MNESFINNSVVNASALIINDSTITFFIFIFPENKLIINAITALQISAIENILLIPAKSNPAISFNHNCL